MINSNDETPPGLDGWQAMQDEGFVSMVGPFYWKRFADGLRFRFPASSKHVNRSGVMHGGAIMTFADRSMGTAARDGNENILQATVQLDVQFIAAVRIGEILESRPVIVRTKGRTMFIRTEMFVGTTPVAWASGVWKVLGERATPRY